MSDKQIVNRLIPDEISKRLKALGFDPGIPVYEIAEPRILLDAVKKALFDSTYLEPISIPFRSEKEADAETPVGRGVNVVVEMVQAVYLPLEPHVGSGTFGCHNVPDWYVRGFLFMNPVDPHENPVRVHVYLQIDEGDGKEKIELAIVQFVHKPSNATPDTALVYA